MSNLINPSPRKYSLPSALKHGVHSNILFLPGEDPQEYEKLKAALFAEYKPSGCSEVKVMTAIVNTYWQEERLELYEHVQFLRADIPSRESSRNPFADAIASFRIELVKHRRGRGKYDEQPPSEDPPVQEVEKVQEVERTDDELLVELGNLVTIDHLDKRLDVENKIHAKRDRLFKSFFQIRAMKPLIGLAEAPPNSSIGSTPVLELTAAEPIKPSELSVETSVLEPTATEPTIPSEVSGELPVLESPATAPTKPSEVSGVTSVLEPTATEPTIPSEVSGELPVLESPTTDPTIPSELSAEMPVSEPPVIEPIESSEAVGETPVLEPPATEPEFLEFLDDKPASAATNPDWDFLE